MLVTGASGFVGRWLVARLPRRRFVPRVYRFFLLCILVFFVALSFVAVTMLKRGYKLRH